MASPPSKKRKLTNRKYESGGRGKNCDHHQSEFECEKAKRIAEHMEISSKVMICSPILTVIVGVGKNEQTFLVHENLYALHTMSISFPGKENKKLLKLPEFTSGLFVHFVHWMYTGYIDPDLSHEMGVFEDLYNLGDMLDCTIFQNYCMHEILHNAQSVTEEENSWPEMWRAAVAYENIDPDSNLRKLMSEAISWRRSNYSKNKSFWATEEPEFAETLKEVPDLGRDINLSDFHALETTPPWDTQWEDRYLWEEPCMGERWAEQILQRRSRCEVESAAISQCVRSELESAHLKKYQTT